MKHLRPLLCITAVLAAALLAQDAAPEPSGTPYRQALLTRPVWEILMSCGDLMWLVLATFIIGLAIAGERFIGLRRRRHVPRDFDKDVVHAVDTRGVDAGLALCLDKPSSLGRVLHAALLRHGTARQELEAAVADEASRVRYDLRHNVRAVGFMGVLAMLLGLACTCVCLVDALDRAALAGAVETLFAGAAVALVPTAFGLLAATVLYCAYFYLNGKADDIVREIDERGKNAVVTLDRRARQSIRLIEDIDEHVATKDMPAVKEPPPDLAKELEVTHREGSGVKTSITTPINLPAAEPPQGEAAKGGGGKK